MFGVRVGVLVVCLLGMCAAANISKLPSIDSISPASGLVCLQSQSTLIVVPSVMSTHSLIFIVLIILGCHLLDLF